MNDFETTVKHKYLNLLREFKEAVQNYGIGSLEVSLLRRKIDEFEHFFDEYFGLIL